MSGMWFLGTAMAVVALVVVVAFIGRREKHRPEYDPWEIWRDDV